LEKLGKNLESFFARQQYQVRRTRLVAAIARAKVFPNFLWRLAGDQG
jgi:hypothetical protein